MGATSSLEGVTPETNNFSCKVNNFDTEIQDSAPLNGFSSLMQIVNNPSEIKPDLEESGMLRIKTASQWAQDAAIRPDPKRLWLSLWHEGELCCLFADSNLGKSIYAVEIVNEIAKTDKIIYFDFELSDKQFQLRYTDDFGEIFPFSDNFMRAEIDPNLIDAGDFEDEVISDIERAALLHGINILVIDNITYLCNTSEKGDAAGQLMMRLMQLKKKYGLSILVLAHTPKRPLSSPITQNDLAGSKKLFNFFDSVFAIGRSAKDENLRYIKQIKSRAGAFEFGADNVIVSEIVKEGAWLHFKQIGVSSEKDHLREQSDKDTAQFENNVRDLRSEDKTYQEIANALGVSKSKIGRICKRLNI